MEKKNKIKFDVKTAQINAQRKKERRNTIYAWILLVLFVFWTIGSVLSFVNTFAGCSTSSTGYISAKADEGVAETALTGDEMNGTINDFDITNYPSANYFNIENMVVNDAIDISYSNGVVNSIVFVSSDSNIFTVSTNTTLGVACPDLVVGETYTLSFDISSELGRSMFLLNDFKGTYIQWWSGKSLTITESMLGATIILFPTNANGLPIPGGECSWSSIMINKGTEVMPYFPYFKSLYNAGYNEGYQAAEYGFLNGSTVDASVKITYGVSSSGTASVITQDYSAPLELFNGGFSLAQVFKFYSELPFEMPRSYDFIYFKVKFGSGVNVENFFNSYKFSSSTNAFIKYTTLLLNTSSDGTGTSFRSSFEVDSEGKLSFGENNISSTVDLNSLYLLGLEMPTNTYTESILPFNSYRLVTYNGMYYKGYNNGFNDGALSGDGFNQGYDKGFSEGERNGYDKGFNAGNTVGYSDGFGAGKIEGAATANDYSFMSLISATIDAPIQAFTKMFDFEILGVNLTNFFLSLLSVGIVLVVLKLIFGGA